MTEHDTPTFTTPPPGDASSAKTKVLYGGVGAAIAVLAFGAGAFVFGGLDTRGPTPATEATAPANPAPTTQASAPPRMIEQSAPFSFADLVERVSPAVVAILVSREQRVERGGDNLEGVPEEFRDFLRRFGPRQQQPRTQRGEALGSGFIIDGEGYIVTNNHVVDSGTRISVKLTDGREFQARVVGADAATDVALLKIDNAHNLPTVAFGDDSRVRVGDWVVAVGNPFGLGGTVTAGIVSSIKRDIGEGPYTDFIQIDAPINQGNSGGPTFDTTGRVIAVNSAIYSPSGGSVGIGFAIPASIVQETVRQIKEHGSVTRGWLGVEIQNLTPEVASSLGIANAKGAIISRVVAGGPAEQAGLRQRDVVLAINGRGVDDSRDMTRRVGLLRPGERATFSVVRNGQRTEVSATVARRNDRQLASLPTGKDGQDSDSNDNGSRDAMMSALGMRLVALTDDVRQKFGVDRAATGVLVLAVDPSSDAADKGFRAGDVIVSVGNRDVRTPDDIQRGVRDAVSAGRDSALFLVATARGQRFVALKIARG